MNSYDNLLLLSAKVEKLRALSPVLNKLVKGSGSVLASLVHDMENELDELCEAYAKEFPSKVMTHSIQICGDSKSDLKSIDQELVVKFGNDIGICHFEEDNQLFVDVNESSIKKVQKFIASILKKYLNAYVYGGVEKVETLNDRRVILGLDEPLKQLERKGEVVDVSLPKEVCDDLMEKWTKSVSEANDRHNSFVAIFNSLK